MIYLLKTNGQNALALIDDDGMVLAINWLVNSNTEELIAELEAGNDLHITDHMLDEPVPAEKVFRCQDWESHIIASQLNCL